MTPHKLYTAEQADQVLPLVRAIVEDLREVYVRIRGSLSALGTLEELNDISGDHRLPRGVREDLAEMRSCMAELGELGVRVGDPEIGLVTMRGLHRGDVVNLCWKLGEDRVRFWFPQGGDYASRRPLAPASV